MGGHFSDGILEYWDLVGGWDTGKGIRAEGERLLGQEGFFSIYFHF